MSDSKPPFSLSAIADRAWNRIIESAFNTGWTPITRLAETAVIAYVLIKRVMEIYLVLDAG